MDVETGWYYLNSRNYNPEIGCFINADGLVGQTGDILGHNTYAYCQKNHVMYVDPSRRFATSTFLIELAVSSLVTWAAGEIFGH